MLLSSLRPSFPPLMLTLDSLCIRYSLLDRAYVIKKTILLALHGIIGIHRQIQALGAACCPPESCAAIGFHRDIACDCVNHSFHGIHQPRGASCRWQKTERVAQAKMPVGSASQRRWLRHI